MKNIVGLDLGPGSIGWAVLKVEPHEDVPDGKKTIEGADVRIILVDGKRMSSFQNGSSISATKERTKFRAARRLYQRRALRRERLLRVLRVMDFLPEHYAQELTRFGKFTKEVRLPWTKDEAGKPLFLFQDSYEEMLREFRQHQPEWLKGGARVPYDWTIYYLRKKALTQALTPYELAWVLLKFNQKRGYNYIRGMADEYKEEDASREKAEILTLRVESVTQGDKAKKGEFFWNVRLSNGMVFMPSFAEKPQWEGTERDFLVVTKLDSDGNPMKEKTPEISSPDPVDKAWKRKSEISINNSGKMVGEYIYDTLLETPKQKIIGCFVQTINRCFYKDELMAILKKQQELLPQLRNRELYERCIYELYPNNNGYRQNIAGRDFAYLLGQDILLYQRPLKSKKSQIDECPYEGHTYTDKKTGEKKHVGVKCIARSHPLYQEFRLWQFVGSLRIFQHERVTESGTLQVDVDVTDEILTTEKREEMFNTLSMLKEVNQKTFLTKCLGVKKEEKTQPLPYYWNYSQDDSKKYPCCPTNVVILSALSKVDKSRALPDSGRLKKLWHILYSVSDTDQLQRTLENYANDEKLPKEAFVKAFSKIPAFEKSYGSYSAKAINRLLPLMRMGKHWCEENINKDTRERINHIIDGEVDDNIQEKVRGKFRTFTRIEQFQGLSLSQACYLVYGRYNEAIETSKWNCPEDIDTFLCRFRQHSLRNPIVERVVIETMRTVRDIWKAYGSIDEFHIEMGRDLCKTKEQRKKATDRNHESEKRNQRIRTMLYEFAKPGSPIENVHPYSPKHQEKLQIYEEWTLDNLEESDPQYKFVNEMRVNAQPTTEDIKRYRLWMEQKYVSPYTGKIIPLADLFKEGYYDVDHIIPRSRFFDDSMQNKVICEAAVNKLKNDQLGMEFIRGHAGEPVTIAGGNTVRVLSEEEYTKHVATNYNHLAGKKKRLLMDDIPDGFINRQLNDSRYIARYVTSLLSNIVRRDHNDDGVKSVNVITTNGAITKRLRDEWGLNDVWNRIILPRFQRMNRLPPVKDKYTPAGEYTAINARGHEIPSVPLVRREGFSFKRIDHRHHALDAIVIACTSRLHVELMNNEAAKNRARYHQLSHMLRRYEEETCQDGIRRLVPKEFLKPWATFTTDVENALRNIVVSFKQNLRVVTRSVNYYTHYKDGKKVVERQIKGDMWAIRKSMHEETYYGRVKLAYLTGEENKYYYATRKVLDTSFDEKNIKKITDTGIQKILLAHLSRHNNDPKEAFSPDGIEEMNRNIRELNGGHDHQPIKKVRIYRGGEKRFAVGQTGNNPSKFVKTAQGNNLYLAVYEQEMLSQSTGKKKRVRSFVSVPLNIVIDRLKQGLTPVPPNEMGVDPIFTLSPGDLVYLPTSEERMNGVDATALSKERIYKTVSFDDEHCNFIPHSVASVILDGVEFESHNKVQKAESGEIIWKTCIPIKVDRLGRIIEINGQKI